MLLYANPGWGSAIVEAQFALLGLAAEIRDVGDVFQSAAARDALAPVNPLTQVPTLVLDGGQILTESAAITLHLADVTGSDRLVPKTGAAERPAFLRWLVYLVANLYPTFTYADAPARFVPDEGAREGFAQTVGAYRQRLYRTMEEAAGAPWFLGARFSAIDLYIAVFTQWGPRRPWFAEHTPRLHAIAKAVDAMPELAAVWRRNFPEG